MFEPLVLTLKALLRQGELDKPFTGGIGSFKLYVMIANHLEKEIGGADKLQSLGRVFVSFLDRYRTGGEGELNQGSILRSEGGEAVFKGIFRIKDVGVMFLSAWNTMKMCAKYWKGVGRGVPFQYSYVGCLIDHTFLRRERNTSIRKAQKAISSNVMETKAVEYNKVAFMGAVLNPRSELVPQYLQQQHQTLQQSQTQTQTQFTFKHPGKTTEKGASKKGASKKRARAADLLGGEGRGSQAAKKAGKKRMGAGSLVEGALDPGADRVKVKKRRGAGSLVEGTVDADADMLAKGYGYESAMAFENEKEVNF